MNIQIFTIHLREKTSLRLADRPTERELRQIYKSLLIAVFGPVCQWLSHQVGVVETFMLQRFFHQFDRLQCCLGVKVTVCTDDLRTFYAHIHTHNLCTCNQCSVYCNMFH